MGKHHYPLTSESGIKYDLTFEYDDGEFIAARLIHGTYKSKGTNVIPENVAKMNVHLNNGTFELVEKISEPKVTQAARFSDGRLLLLVNGLLDRKGDVLFIQQDDKSFKKVKLKNGIGSSRTVQYMTEDNVKIVFERGQQVTYGDRLLAVEKDVAPLNAYGIKVEKPPKHHDPFSEMTDHVRSVIAAQDQKKKPSPRP